MKIIDHTPFVSADGQISRTDRLKATWKYGASWLQEIEAQKVVVDYLEKGLEKGYTLLRNVTPAGLGVGIPFILVGPTGIFVMYATNLRGMFRARGEEWGTIEGNSFKAAKVNLLTRTTRLARAVQVHLQRQGYGESLNVEPILLCIDPGMHVDSVRPIIRVVQRDALDRLAVSISQARLVLSPETAQEIVNSILNPHPPQATPAGTPAPATQPAPVEDGHVPAFIKDEGTQPQPEPATPSAESMGFDFTEETPVEAEPVPAPATEIFGRPQETSFAQPQGGRAVASKQKLSRKQIVLLAGMLVVECIILAVGAILLLPYFSS